MTEELQSTLLLLSPEFLIVATAFLVIFADLFLKDSHRNSHGCALLGLFAAFSASVALQVQDYLPNLVPYPDIAHVLAFDPVAFYLKSLVLLLAFGSCALSYGAFQEEARHAGEYYCLILFATLGAMVAVSSQEFLTFFIAFELLSLPLYMLAGFRRYDPQSAEAGVKYFLTGAFSTAIMLFGMSWVYGALGTTSFAQMAAQMQTLTSPPNALLVGMVLVLVGLAFKVSAAPFHNWAPDVYSGAPTAVVTFLSTVPKAAMAGVILRLFWTNLNIGSPTFAFSTDWVIVFVILSLLSMFIGNLSALPQTDVKRMLAYSGVAQIGYLLLGLAACSVQSGAGAMGAGATLFYASAYTLSNFLAWACVYFVCRMAPDSKVERFSGLFQRSPILAFGLLIAFMSLAGVPPLVGFIGKFSLFRAIYQAQWPFMVVFGILNSVISLYYYFKVLRAAFFNESSAEPIVLSVPHRLVLLLFTGLVVVLGLWPGLLDYCFDIAHVVIK